MTASKAQTPTGYQGELNLETVLGDLARISAWLAENVENDEAQSAASDLNEIHAWLLGNLGRTLDI